MSGKTKLPDELLDAMSGGTFSYQGQPIYTFGKISGRGIEAETSDGMKFFPWSDKAREDFKGFFGVDQLKVMKATFDSSQDYPLEDYAGTPSAVED